MVPFPSKGVSPKKPSGPLTHVRNRPLLETPVIISDGSGSDGAGTFPPPKAEVPSATTVAAPVQGSVGSLSKVGPTLDPKKPEVEPSVGLPQSAAPITEAASTDDAASTWAAFVAEEIKSVEEAGRTTPPSTMPTTAQSAEPKDALGVPDSSHAPMVGPLSLDWPAFTRNAGSVSFLDMTALGRRDAGLVQEYTDTDASWSGAVLERFLQHHWTAYQVPVALPCDRTMVFDSFHGIYLEGMLQFLTGACSLPMSVDSRF